jgi:ATP-dependent DNA helicase RecG
MLDFVKVNEILESIKTEPSEAYESETVEFKLYESKSAFYNKSQDIAAELSAFANRLGGLLVVGVKDSSNVNNMDWSSQLAGFEALDCYEVDKRIRGNLKPAITLETVNHEFEGKNYLLIQVAKSNCGLVMTASGKCYIRAGRDSNPMTPQEVETNIKSSNSYDWSSEIIEAIDVKDALDDHQVEEAMIEYKSINGFGESSIPQEHFLEKIGVTSRGKLTKSGLLFLGKSEVLRSLIGNIEYRFSKRERGGALPINKVWSSSIWEAITRISELLKQVIEYNKFDYEGKVYTYPNICKTAFEEALINSLIHRDYTISGLTTIEIDESSVTFVNPGNFYGGITPFNIFTHAPRHRNPALASILMNFGLVDRAGMGIRRMNIESLRLGRREPKFLPENNCISTSLEIGTVKKGVFVIASPYEDYDVAELFLINLLYGNGYEEIFSVLKNISAVVAEPWRDVQLALKRLSCLSLVGNKDGVFLEVKDSHRESLCAYRKIKSFQSSDAYVSIFRYLYDKGEVTSNELFGILKLDSLAKTQRLLRESRFIDKIQNDSGVTWRLANHQIINGD